MLMAQGRAAKLHYLANHFRVLVPGDHVACARTGEPIALEDLRYWSVTRQEPYSTAQFASEAEAAA
ncbi:DUF2093 domain-containing protein [uncultured Sphingomonas sp.]|uniref:DUF2093 domain-containing protein n=1 Tax=uncultured Sphingomonas sp. TaxID=158754 RepID=UPI0025E84080|nr:DUF2093 domain-containing protein [uncultured Sphingomonas sp.]